MTVAKKTKQQAIPVVVRLPKKVVAAIDKAARVNCRSRSKEVQARINQTFAVGGS